MTRTDFRPWASVVVLAAVLAYIGCSTATTPPAATSSRTPDPAHGGDAVAKTGPSGGDAASGPEKLFAMLGNPAAVLVVSGEQGNYMEPCGCSADQLGGLIRRYDLVERLHGRNWPTALVELGTLIKNPATGLGGFEQAKIKFDFALKALALLKYNALALSAEDLKIGVFEAFGLFENSLGKTTRIVVANVEPDPDFKKLFQTSVIAPVGGVALGITAVIDPEALEKLVDPEKNKLLTVVKPPGEVLPSVLGELESKSTYQILMVQGPPELARLLAETNSGFDIVVSTSESDEPLSREPEVLNGGKTTLVSVGKKGKYVGVFGFYPEEKERLRYQLETLDKHYDGAAAPMRHLIRDEYRNTLKAIGVVENFVRRDYVGGAPGATFVGAETCKECHKKTFAFWSKTKHAQAFASLLTDPKPNTAFDAECVSCHTTGFEYNSGWVSKPATPHLEGNQCENCHGPGSKHCAAPDNAEYLEAISVTIEQAEKNRLCYHCHDEDNSPKFEIAEYWSKIKHNALDDYSDPKVHQPVFPKVLRPKSATGAK
jgi:hypothetical protein